jgi:hypothetical protein
VSTHLLTSRQRCRRRKCQNLRRRENLKVRNHHRRRRHHRRLLRYRRHLQTIFISTTVANPTTPTRTN